MIAPSVASSSLDRVVQPDVVVALGVGHPFNPLGRIKGAEPRVEQLLGVCRIDLRSRHAGCHQVLLNGGPIFFAQPADDPSCFRAVEVESVLRSANAVIDIDVDPRLKECALADNLQRLIAHDEWVHQHNQDNRRKNGETGDEFSRVKRLSKCV